MKILGIDPGTATTGWAVIAENKGNFEIQSHGCINTSKHKSDCDRLVEIAMDVEEIIRKYKPDEAAVENLFFFKNLKTAITVAQARGVLLYKLKKLGLAVHEYTPLQVKQALTGYGRAEKNQIQQMVKSILKLKCIPRPDDAADAAAIAICHINSRKLKEKLS
jgi:crossover junction endodeoxyribonuclease RuvC